MSLPASPVVIPTLRARARFAGSSCVLCRRPACSHNAHSLGIRFERQLNSKGLAFCKEL